MAWYPGAIKMELQPESDQQQAIRPTQFIVHSIIAPWTARRTYEFWRDSTNLESHFGVDYMGDVGQYIGTETRADANAGANRRPDGTGAVSAETASNLQGSDPWNAKQLEDLIAIGAWLHHEHDIPLRICRSHDDPGFGYHSMFPQWSTSGTACPGAARIRQFREVVFPGIVARANGTTEEDDMTPEQAKQLKELHELLTPYAGWDYRGKLGDKPDPRDAFGYLRDTETRARRIEDRLAQLEQRPMTDDQVAAIAAAVAAHPALAKAIADTLAARLKD